MKIFPVTESYYITYLSIRSPEAQLNTSMDFPLDTISLLRLLSQHSSSTYVLPLKYFHPVAEFKLLVHRATPH